MNSVADLGLTLLRIVLSGVCLVLGTDNRRDIWCVVANLRQPEDLKQDRLDEKAAHTASTLLSSTGITWGKGKLPTQVWSLTFSISEELTVKVMVSWATVLVDFGKNYSLLWYSYIFG